VRRKDEVASIPAVREAAVELQGSTTADDQEAPSNRSNKP
jgi:hypothetical protein